MEEDKKINGNTTVSGTQYIGYQGTISVSIVKNNKVLKTRQYHNSGMPKLFEFLAKCLGGSNSEFLRPVKIKLFRYSGAEIIGAAPPKDFRWEEAWDGSEYQPIQVSPYLLYNTTPVIRKRLIETDVATSSSKAYLENTQYEVTLHFTAPAAYLAEDVIHMVGLYPNNAISDKDEVSAYYLFTNEKNEWDPLELSEINGNFSIFIDWTLTVSNKTK